MDFIYESSRLIQEKAIEFCGFPVDLLVTDTGDFRFYAEIPLHRFTVIAPADREEAWPQGVSDALTAIYQRIAWRR